MAYGLDKRRLGGTVLPECRLIAVGVAVTVGFRVIRSKCCITQKHRRADFYDSRDGLSLTGQFVEVKNGRNCRL